MTQLHRALADYLSLRRSLGYKLRRSEKLLQQFIDFLEAAGAQTITTKHAVAWACQPENGSASWWAHRLSVVRVFANYLHAVDAAAEVPPRDCRADRSGQHAALAASSGDLPNPDRAARGHWNAGGRGDRLGWARL